MIYPFTKRPFIFEDEQCEVIVGKRSFIKTFNIVASVMWIALSSIQLSAQNGYLDNTYNSGGYNLTILSEYPMIIPFDMLVQPDQKSVVACEGWTASGIDLLLVRYNVDGTLDQTFGSGGYTSFDSGGMIERVTSIAIQSDGKLIACGNMYISEGDINPSKWFAVRFDENGALDTSYGTSGAALMGSAEFVPLKAYDCAIQSDDQLLMVGETNTTGYDRGTVVRLDADGLPDATFGIGGVLFPYPQEVYNGIMGIGIQPDGMIVVCGDLLIAPNLLENDYLIMRFDQSGVLDATFDADGIVTTDSGDLYGSLYYVDFQTDGKLLFSGIYHSSDVLIGYYTSVLRLNENGSMDNSFSADGLALINHNPIAEDLPHGIAVKSDGNVMVTFATTQPPPANYSLFMLQQYLPNGAPDPSFGVDGLVQLNLTGGNAAQTMALQADDKVMMAGLGANVAENVSTLVTARVLPVAVPSAIESLSLDANLSVYPVPSSGRETIEFTLGKAANMGVALYDLQGKVVRTFIEKQMFAAGTHRINLELSDDIIAGVYFLKLTDAAGNNAVVQLIVE